MSDFIIKTEQRANPSTYDGQDLRGLTTLTCYPVGNTNFVEASTTINPTTGCQFPVNTLLDNTTAFEKDKTYDDCIARYQQTASGKNDFNAAFPNINLTASEIATASTAFHIDERGHTPIILINHGEDGLLDFARQQSWRYIFPSEPT